MGPGFVSESGMPVDCVTCIVSDSGGDGRGAAATMAAEGAELLKGRKDSAGDCVTCIVSD